MLTLCVCVVSPQESPSSSPVSSLPLNSPLDEHERRISQSHYPGESLDDNRSPGHNMMGRMMGELMQTNTHILVSQMTRLDFLMLVQLLVS